MTNRIFSALAFASVALGALPALAAADPAPTGASAAQGQTQTSTPVVGKNILDTVNTSPNFSTLAVALKDASFANALTGKGPLTVFAPDNAAFASLPKGTFDTLEKPENKVQLAGILSYHVVAGDYTAAKLTSLVKKGHGKATLKTITGSTLILMKKKPSGLTIKDEKGNVADVTTTDLATSNGVIHVVDKVLMPAS